MLNDDIRRATRGNLIPLWRLAKQLGISEPTMTRWLRTELPEEKRMRIMNAIEELKKEGK